MRFRGTLSWLLVARIAAGAGILALLLLLLLAAMPLGWLRGPAERALTVSMGRPVRIGAVERVDGVGLSPRIALRDIAIAQPAWAGAGDMLTLRAATLRLPLLPLLRGKARPRDLDVDGLRVALVQDEQRRANWKGGRKGGGDAPDFGTVRIRDARVTLADARRHLALTAAVAADAAGFTIDATGTHRGRPARLALRGAAVGGTARWPFRAMFASPLATLRLDALADRPLDFDHFAAAATARGSDLNRLDDLILAGLPGTQDVTLRAQVRHDGDDWTLTGLAGTLGASDIAGRVMVTKRDGRAHVDARLRSASFSFDDLASDEARARDAARKTITGKRLIPDTRIDLAKLDDTDGRLDIAVARLRAPGRSVVKSFATTLTLDRSRLVARPLVASLAHGRLEGQAIVDQRAGSPPKLTIDVALVGARLEDIVPANRITGPLRGRIRLAGRGRRIREALAGADGQVMFASRGGSVERATAEMMGRNAGAAFGALLGDGAARTPLRCFGVKMTARRGVLTPGLFVLDTGVMSADGRGSVRLSDERVALVLDGRSKHPGLARLPAPIEIGGTLVEPQVETDDAGIASAKTILKTLGGAIGRLFGGGEDIPAAPDRDCGALMAKLG